MGKKKVHMDRHHRRPQSLFLPGETGKDDPKNISIVPVELHRAYHRLFRNFEPKQVAEILTRDWIDSDWVLIAQKRHKKRRRKFERTTHIECSNCGSRCTIKNVKKKVQEEL